MTRVATPHKGPTPGAPASPGFQQRLGLFDATMLVAGTMIGSGIFVVSSEVARYTGSSGWLMGVWVLTGVMTLMGALSYAELSAAMPQAGGQYIFLREAYAPLPGFLYGWTCFLVIQTGSIAAVAVVFAKYLGVLVPYLGTGHTLLEVKDVNLVITLPLPWLEKPLEIFKRPEFTISYGQLVAVGIVVLLTLLNCRGVREGKWVQNLFTLAKIGALVVLIVLGLTVAADARAIAVNTADPWQVSLAARTTERYQQVLEWLPQGGLLVMLIVAGAVMTGPLFAADAWNNVTFTAGEVMNPRRNLPLSLFLGAGLVIVLYLLANVAYLAALPVEGDAQLAAQLKREYDAASTPEEKAAVEKKYAAATFKLGISHAREERVGTAVLEQASPSLGVRFMAIAIMVSTFGCVNGLILMGARLYYAMARDGLFFKSVGGLNGRGVPAAGLILQGIWSVLLVFSGSYDELLDFVMFAVLLFYVLTVTGLFILRWRQPNLERPYRAFAYPVMPALYVLLCAVISAILLVVKPENTWPGLILVLAGIPVYFVWRLLGPRSAAVRHPS
jgi:APA family basic amino acid/polyamine antiporter